MKLQEAYAAYDDGKISTRSWWQSRTPPPRTRSSGWRPTGEPIVTDGEQRESSFATYPITDTLAGTGLADNLAGDGQYFAIFDDGHHRQLPRLTGGPFRYKTFASEFVEQEQGDRVASGQAGGDRALDADAAAPARGRDPRLLARRVPRPTCATRSRRTSASASRAGAVRVSIDFTEGRLANKNDSRNPWTGNDMLQEFIDLNNRVIDRFSRRGAHEHRHPHLPRRRLRLGALQGRAVREAAEQDVPAQRGLLPDPVRERGRPREGLQAVRRSTAARTPTACRRCASWA